MSYKMIIFDLDGTLINSLEGIAYSMNKVLEKYHLPCHDTETYRNFIGEGMKKLAYKALPTDNNEQRMVEQCYEEMKKQYDLHWAKGMQLYEGIEEVLNILQTQGITMAINSNKNDEHVKLIVDQYLSKWSFSHIIGARLSIPRKPDPTGVNIIIEDNRVLPDQCLYVGDTEVDMMTAYNAKVDAIGALWGFRTEDELKGYHPKVLLKKPLGLLDIL